VGRRLGGAIQCSDASERVRIPPGTGYEDNVSTVTPASVLAKAGIVTGEVTEMMVTERLEKDSGTVVSPAKLTGTLQLKNDCPNQTVCLITGKI